MLQVTQLRASLARNPADMSPVELASLVETIALQTLNVASHTSDRTGLVKELSWAAIDTAASAAVHFIHFFRFAESEHRVAMLTQLAEFVGCNPDACKWDINIKGDGDCFHAFVCLEASEA